MIVKGSLECVVACGAAGIYKFRDCSQPLLLDWGTPAYINTL